MPYLLAASANGEEGTLRMHWPFLRFYGALGRGTRDEWRRAKTVKLDTVGPSLGERLDTYAASNCVPVDDAQAQQALRGSFDPTTLLPAVVRGALLTSSAQVKWIIEFRGIQNDGRQVNLVFPPERFGTYLDENGKAYQTFQVRPIGNWTVIFTSTYVGGVKSQTVFDVGNSSSVSFGPVEQLPKALLDQMAAGRKG